MRSADLKARLRRAKRAQSGFSLSETMVAILLLLLVGGMIASTIQLAVRHFQARTQEADAQLLCSALSLFVQNELTYASDIAAAGDGQIRFTDHVQGFGTNCALVTTEEGRLAVEYHRTEGGAAQAKYFEAVGEGTYSGRKALREQHSVAYAAGQANVTIRVLDQTGRILAENSFAVRPLAP